MRKLFEALSEYGVDMIVTPIKNGEGVRVRFDKYPYRMGFVVDDIVIKETNVDLIATIILQELEEFVNETKEVIE